MSRTLLIDPPGAFSSKEELEKFIQEAQQLDDADQEPVKSAIEQARAHLRDKQEDGRE